MSFHLCVSHNKCHVGKIFRLKHPKEILGHLRLWHLNSDREHPYVVERQLTVISSENVELSLDNVSSMSATRSWLEFRGSDLLPIVAFDVKYMNIIHPVNAIVPSKVDDFGVDQAACSGDTSRWLISTHGWFHPGQSFSVQVKDIVKLTQLVRLSSEDINFLVKSYC